MTPRELIDSLVEGEYSGCVLTNHFYHGNTGIDRNLPWVEFVTHYEKDYLECKKLAQIYGLDVIFGIEEHLYSGLEILCYGITPQFLYDRPELLDLSPQVWYNALTDFGALMVQAHPFRNRPYITSPGLLPLEFIDGIEVYNICNSEAENKKAQKIADKHPEWVLTSGADAHSGSLVCSGGIVTDVRITDEITLADVLKSKKYELL